MTDKPFAASPHVWMFGLATEFSSNERDGVPMFASMNLDGVLRVEVGAGGSGSFVQISDVPWRNGGFDVNSIEALAVSNMNYIYDPIADTASRLTGGTVTGVPLDPAFHIGADSRAFDYGFDAASGFWIASPPRDDIQWTVNNTAAVNTAATATQAAPGAGLRNVIQAITASVMCSATFADAVIVRVLDGAAGPVLWSGYIAPVFDPTTAGAKGFGVIQLSGLNIPCSEDTAAVIEFSAAGGADTYESVSMQGAIRAA